MLYLSIVIERHLQPVIARYAREYPVLAIVGPRQSGKTTLARHLFPKHNYLSLENLDLRRQAETDPRGFFDDHPGSLILDEVQRVPGLFSYLQEKTDLEGGESRYILTGSQQFLLMAGITQSLAGRIATFKLFPFTVAELKGYPPDKNTGEIFEVKTDRIQAKPIANTAEMIWKGLYPRIYDKHLDAGKWLEEYIQTYVERDVRSLTNVGDLRSFEAFIKACAANSGQLLNLTALSSAVGVSIPTAKRWVSLLETSGLLFLLPPYHRNFRKRLVKTPKLYFIDTGLLCRLLSIRTPEELRSYPLYGSIFETFVVSEMYKRIAHTGEPSSLFFYRDKTGAEVDLIADLGMGKVLPIEIKSTRTYSDDLSESVRKWVAALGKSKGVGLVLYDGNQAVGIKGPISTVPWWSL